MMAAKLFPTFDKLIMIFCKLLQNHIIFNNTRTDKAKCDNWLSCLFQQHQHILWQLSAQFTPGKRFKELLTLVITLIIQIKDEKGTIKSFSPSRRFLKFYATILPGEGLRTPPKRSDSFADLLIYWSSPVRRPKFLSSYHGRHWYHVSAKIISSLSVGYAAFNKSVR